MPFLLYLRPHPRTFHLVSDTSTLVIRCPVDGGDASGETESPTAIVEYLSNEEVDQIGLVRITKGRGAEGVLGLISVPCEATGSRETFLVIIAASATLPSIIPPSSNNLTISKILAVEFHCLTSGAWDENLPPPTQSFSSGYDDQGFPLSEDVNNAYSGHTTSASLSNRSGSPYPQQPLPGATILPHPCAGIRSYLSAGTFFYATTGTWDLSKRLPVWDRFNHLDGNGSAGDSEEPGAALRDFDDRFVWNTNILRPLLDFRQTLSSIDRSSLDSNLFLVPVIQGFCNILPLGGGPLGQTHLGLISRLGWKRAGTRYATRGISDEGDVANFVETETVLANEEYCCSYVQIRGSVPLFWEQQGNQTFGQKVTITRPQAASQPAFDRHFMDLLAHYQSVHVLNLLGSGGTEAQLSVAYTAHVKTLSRALRSDLPEEEEDSGETDVPDIGMTSYDFHANVKSAPEGHGVIKEDLERRNRQIVMARDRYGYSLIDLSKGTVVLRQAGVFRINCLDCLDRTNYVEDVLSALALASVQAMGLISTSSLSSSALNVAHRTLWADNGDNLSKIYAGTGALNSSVTRTGGRKTFASLLSDASKSVGRAIQASFGDEAKGAAIDLLVGMSSGQKPVTVWNPIAQAVRRALADKIDDYTIPKDVSIYVGTWNLNGKPIGDVEPWLFPTGTHEADIYVMGFQELVPLNAQQILNTDPEARRRCDGVLAKALARRGNFIPLRTEQLVGTSLHVYARESFLPVITKVEGATRKTGVRGMAGNKGGVGVRFDVHDTSICVMTCHLAAGHKNVAERNADYRTISSQLTFQRGKSIDSHDVVIWAADFNYRIDLDGATARECAETDDLETLWEADQLSHAMSRNEAFPGYEEGQIAFRPTYKYDVGSTEYDTGEKQRIPAWTDRVLFKGKALHQRKYARSELLTSDHRPVYALFTAVAREVNEAKKAAILEEVSRAELQKQGAIHGVKVNPRRHYDSLASPEPRLDVGVTPGAVRKSAPPLPPPKRADTLDLIDMDAELPTSLSIPTRKSTTGSSNNSSGLTGLAGKAIPPPPSRIARKLPPPNPQSEPFHPSPSSSLVEEDYVRIRLSSSPSSSSGTKPPLPPRTLPPALPSRSGTTDSGKTAISQNAATFPLSLSRTSSASSMGSQMLFRADSAGSSQLGNLNLNGSVSSLTPNGSNGSKDARRMPSPAQNGNPSAPAMVEAPLPSAGPRFVPKASTLAMFTAARAAPPAQASAKPSSGPAIPPKVSPVTNQPSPIPAPSPLTSTRAEALAGVLSHPSPSKAATPDQEGEERPMTVADRMKLFENGRVGSASASGAQGLKTKPMVPVKLGRSDSGL